MREIGRRLPDAELEIMKIVWGANGPVSSAYVMAQIEPPDRWAVTTVLNFLARLTEKGFLRTEKQGKSNLYSPLVDEERYLEQEGRSVLARLYGNSLSSLVASLYNGRAIGDDDLAELRRFIDEKTGGGKPC